MSITDKNRIGTFISITIVYLISSSVLKAQNSQTTYYIWRADSVHIYSDRNINGAVLKKLPYGRKVDVIKIYEDEVLSSIPVISEKIRRILPKTQWAHIEVEGKAGFLFLDQLGTLTPFKKNQNGVEEVKKYFNRVFMMKDSVLIKKNYPIPSSNDFYTVNIDSVSYKNGAYVLNSFFDGCSESSFSVPEWDFNDVYSVLAVSSNHIIKSSSGDISSELEFMKVEDGKYTFEDLFGFREFYIKEIDNEQIKFGWYSCD